MLRTPWRPVLAAVALSFAALQAVPAAGPRGPRITDLGVLPGDTHSLAVDLSDRTEIPGYSYTVTDTGAATGLHAFLWKKGRMTALPGLGGAESRAWGINQRGQVVGFADTADGQRHAVLWSKGRVKDLGTLPGGAFSSAWEINNRGVICGEADTAAGERHAVIWRKGQIQDLGTLPGTTRSVAADLNEKDQVVGWCTATRADGSGTDTYPFLWQRNRMKALAGLAEDGRGLARRINNRGEVVGLSYDADGARHPVSWRKSVLRDLGIPEGADYAAAWGNNEHGLIVGERGPEGSWHALLWQLISRTPTDLNELPAAEGWDWLSSTAVNEKAQITGFGGRNGAARAYLLIP